MKRSDERENILFVSGSVCIIPPRAHLLNQSRSTRAKVCSPRKVLVRQRVVRVLRDVVV